VISIAIDPSVKRPMINRKDMPTTHSHFDTVEVSRFESLIGYLQKLIIDNLLILVVLPVKQSHRIAHHASILLVPFITNTAGNLNFTISVLWAHR
jgi:hypothetical protein